VFLVIGVIGIALLLLTIFFADFLDAVIPDLGLISGPVIGASDVLGVDLATLLGRIASRAAGDGDGDGAIPPPPSAAATVDV
jgi:hypothetical protein